MDNLFKAATIVRGSSLVLRSLVSALKMLCIFCRREKQLEFDLRIKPGTKSSTIVRSRRKRRPF